MKNLIIKWGLYLILCIIWGSSFELMKLGMFENHDLSKPVLTAFQVAALRMLSAGLVMLPFAIKAIKELQKNVIWYVVLSGLLGSFFPAFLFCVAETKIGGAIAGSLNALTPLFVVIMGALIYKAKTTTNKIIGVIIGLVGSVVLIFANTSHHELSDLLYIFYVVIATIMYGINVNMVSRKLQGVASLAIAAVAFTFLIIPSIIILYFTNYFTLPLMENKYFVATTAASVLGILGTAIASILFYMLVKRASGLFASMVTYGIPFVAIGWGIINHEVVTKLHFVGLFIILSGVYIANKQVKTPTTS